VYQKEIQKIRLPDKMENKWLMRQELRQIATMAE
jgi:hypothetical protein